MPTNQRLVEMISERRLDDLDDPIWDACAEGHFVLNRCRQCERHYWPASSCVEHGSQHMDWVTSPGHGVIHSYVVVHRTNDPDYRDAVPYIGVVVRLDEGVMLHGAMRDPSARVVIGQEVAVAIDSVEPHAAIPRFSPVGEQHRKGTS